MIKSNSLLNKIFAKEATVLFPQIVMFRVIITILFNTWIYCLVTLKTNWNLSHFYHYKWPNVWYKNKIWMFLDPFNKLTDLFLFFFLQGNSFLCVQLMFIYLCKSGFWFYLPFVLQWYNFKYWWKAYVYL